MFLGIGQVSRPRGHLFPSVSLVPHRTPTPLQMITTLVVLYAAKTSRTVQFQDFDGSVLFKVSESRAALY